MLLYVCVTFPDGPGEAVLPACLSRSLPRSLAWRNISRDHGINLAGLARLKQFYGGPPALRLL